MEIFFLGLPVDHSGRMMARMDALRTLLMTTHQPVVEVVRDGTVSIVVDGCDDEMFRDLCVIRVCLHKRRGAGACRGFCVWLLNELEWLHALLPQGTAVLVSIEDDEAETIVETVGIVGREHIELRTRGVSYAVA